MVKTPLDMTKETINTEKRIPRDNPSLTTVEEVVAPVEVEVPVKKKSKKAKKAA